MNKLSTRLLLNTSGVLLAIALVAYGCYLAAAGAGADYIFKFALKNHSALIVDSMRFDAQGRLQGVTLPPLKAMSYDGLRRDLVYRIFDEEGRVLASSDGATAPYLTRGDWSMSPPGEVRTVIDGLPMRILTVPVQRNGHRYYVQSARSERFQLVVGTQHNENSMSAAAGTVILALLVFGATICFTFRRAMLPLLKASTLATSIDPGQVDIRLPETGMPDEILPLVRAFNAALGRLEDGYRVQQEFLADAAHELKTPLTLMRAQLELSGLAEPTSLLLDVDRMSRQVQQLLNLAECSGRQNYYFSNVDAVVAVDDAADHLRRLGRHRGVAIDVTAPETSVPMRADRGALFVLLKNLIENAIQHSPAGGVVSASVQPGYIAVRNSGSCIAASDMPLLFKRFWRGAHRRDEGAGLGLSICWEIAAAHGWKISAESVAHGAEFKLAFADQPA